MLSDCLTFILVIISKLDTVDKQYEYTIGPLSFLHSFDLVLVIVKYMEFVFTSADVTKCLYRNPA